MHIGVPTPFTPARNAPPPVPPPSPGPNPPPVPLPIPVPLPLPRESLMAEASGSPKFGRLGLGTFKSGGPSREGSIASLGFRFTILAWGAANCVQGNLGSFPFVGGVRVWSFAPPPPPAFFAPAGSFETYGERSRGVTSIVFFASAEFGKTRVRNGMVTSKITLTCSVTEMTCVQPKFSSFDQISLTLIGLLVTRSGGSLAGTKKSFRRSPHPPKLVPHRAPIPPRTGPFGTGRELKNSLKFSKNPPPKV